MGAATLWKANLTPWPCLSRAAGDAAAPAHATKYVFHSGASEHPTSKKVIACL